MRSTFSSNAGADPSLPLARTLKVVVALFAIFPLSFAFRPARWVVDRPVTEDAYYALSISRNIAEGKGVTIDGSTPTNGFQPLFVFACVPLFAFAGRDGILAVRLVLGLSWALYIATAVLMGQIVHDFLGSGDEVRARLTPWVTAALYLSAPLILMDHFNGLETGALLFLYALATRPPRFCNCPQARVAFRQRAAGSSSTIRIVRMALLIVTSACPPRAATSHEIAFPSHHAAGFRMRASRPSHPRGAPRSQGRGRCPWP